jgi:hypothetical protein
VLTATVLVIAIGFLFLIIRRPAGTQTERPLLTAERYYAFGATLPLLLCFAAPGVLSFALGQEPSVRLWSNRLTNAGLWLSLGLTVIGVILLWKANRGGGQAPGRLAAAIGLASLPGFLVAIVIALRLLPL